MLICSSGLRPPGSVGEEALVRLAALSGCEGVLIGEGCTLASAASLVPRVLHAGLRVAGIAGPLGGEAGAAGGRRRLPRLSAADRDERSAAIELAARALALAGSVGAALGVLQLGPLTLAARPGDLLQAFRRRELDEGSDGEAILMAALGERRATVGAALDACRWSLDALTRESERANLRLALELAATPWGVPSPREGLDLLAGYDSARLGLVVDPARLSVMRRLGLAISAERHAAVRRAASLISANEAVGLDPGYLPGLGEPDDDLATRAGVATETPVVLVGHPDATDAEVVAAAKGARPSESTSESRPFVGPLPPQR
jgi:sugar phosphate isomerase/epimerase